MDVDPEGLGRAVRARRTDLHLLQGDLVQRSGLSLSTISGIERGLATSLRANSLLALDRALDWPEGTAAMHYSGLTTVRHAIRELGGSPPRGSKYRELLIALAQMTDEDIELIVATINERGHSRHTA